MRAWLQHRHPSLREVVRLEDLDLDSYFLLSGMGYPSYLQRIPRALEDAAQHAVDHLFICVDAEDTPRPVRMAEVTQVVKSAIVDLAKTGIIYGGTIDVVVADCCIESWLLGHSRIVPRQPTSARLVEYKAFWDVSNLDPEQMGTLDGFVTRASFHLAYLKEIFVHHGRSYTKDHPGIAREGNYFDALVERTRAVTGHLATFAHLVEAWDRTIGT